MSAYRPCQRLPGHLARIVVPFGLAESTGLSACSSDSPDMIDAEQADLFADRGDRDSVLDQVFEEDQQVDSATALPLLLSALRQLVGWCHVIRPGSIIVAPGRR